DPAPGEESGGMTQSIAADSLARSDSERDSRNLPDIRLRLLPSKSLPYWVRGLPYNQRMGETDEDRLGMTDEQWEAFQRHTHGFGDQDENGIDLSLLRANLRLTPTERLEKMRRSIIDLRRVRRVG